MSAAGASEPAAERRAARTPERGASRAPRVTLTVLRVLVGAVFVLSGLPKLGTPQVVVDSFVRWGLPLPELFIPALGVLEITAGAMLVLGLLTRYSAVVLAVIMAGAIATAGVIDGGMHLVVPPILGLLCVLLALAGGGAWQLESRLGARRRTPRRETP